MADSCLLCRCGYGTQAQRSGYEYRNPCCQHADAIHIPFLPLFPPYELSCVIFAAQCILAHFYFFVKHFNYHQLHTSGKRRSHEVHIRNSLDSSYLRDTMPDLQWVVLP